MTDMGSSYTIVLLCLCLFEALFIVILLVNHARQRRREKELGRLTLLARHSDRVESVGAITASLAHDLRQPLAAILNNAQAALQFLKQDNPDLGEVREILNDIVLDNGRASAVLTGMNDMLRRRETRHDRMNLAAAIQETLALLHGEIVGQGVISRYTGENDCEVAADKARIQLVIVNLVTNAIEAMQNQPAHQRTMNVTLALAAPGLAQVTVNDSGPGIPEEKGRNLFDPFWKRNARGMGIGLPVCRSIIQAHGGRIWFVNSPDGGASFCFTLPLATAEDLSNKAANSADTQAKPSSAPSPEFAGRRSKATRVLVVDDSAPYRRTLISMLEDAPLVELAGEAADGVEALQKGAELRPDLILMDVSLPGINGIELASRLREMCPDVKLLFLSQYDDPDVVRAVLHTGALGYVLKVDVGKELLPAVAAVLRGDRFLSVSIRDFNTTTDGG
jgi:nitrogen-specific signal transduction histidine kinase/CheY-like chemotaxis protein